MASKLSKVSEERDMTDVIDEPEQEEPEQRSLLYHPQQSLPRWGGKPRVSVFNMIIAIINVLLLIILALSLGLVAQTNTRSCPQSVAQTVELYCKSPKSWFYTSSWPFLLWSTRCQCNSSSYQKIQTGTHFPKWKFAGGGYGLERYTRRRVKTSLTSITSWWLHSEWWNSRSWARGVFEALEI